MKTLAILAATFSTSVFAASQGLEFGQVRGNSTVAVSRVTFQGVPALQVVDLPAEGLEPLVHLAVDDFHDGTIEAEVAGVPSATAPADSRGFVGLAFRVQDDPARFEAFYIRPTNGRAADQLRRNHATQYVGMPDWPWQRLRREHPGVYESYADMVAGEWTRLRIEVEGGKARLFVGAATQPTLIVNDLKLGVDARGGVALWIGPGTEAHFRNVRVLKAD